LPAWSAPLFTNGSSVHPGRRVRLEDTHVGCLVLPDEVNSLDSAVRSRALLIARIEYYHTYACFLVLLGHCWLCLPCGCGGAVGPSRRHCTFCLYYPGWVDICDKLYTPWYLFDLVMCLLTECSHMCDSALCLSCLWVVFQFVLVFSACASPGWRQYQHCLNSLNLSS
jgi:hypothetical protein